MFQTDGHIAVILQYILLMSLDITTHHFLPFYQIIIKFLLFLFLILISFCLYYVISGT